MIETPNWNQDKFGVPIEQTQRYFKKRESFNLSPIIGETLGGYCRRTYEYIKRQEEINIQSHIYGRKMWFCHRNPSNCWICDEINMLWTFIDVLNLVPQSEDLVFYNELGKIQLKPRQ